MEKIANLTQHPATPEQQAAGVVPIARPVSELLTFDTLPTREEMQERAEQLAEIVQQHGLRHGMIGGAPFFMAPLERALRSKGITPLYAFSRRESVETTEPDGSVRKTQVFRHLGFVEA